MKERMKTKAPFASINFFGSFEWIRFDNYCIAQTSQEARDLLRGRAREKNGSKTARKDKVFY